MGTRLMPMLTVGGARKVGRAQAGAAAGGGGGGAVDFFADWSAATGATSTARTDGGKFNGDLDFVEAA